MSWVNTPSGLVNLSPILAWTILCTMSHCVQFRSPSTEVYDVTFLLTFGLAFTLLPIVKFCVRHASFVHPVLRIVFPTVLE